MSIQLFNYTDSDFMKEAGMAVGSDPMSVNGQVVQPPSILYGDGVTVVCY